MQLDAELASFLASPVMIITGTSDDGNRPDIARAVGARVAADHGVVRIVLSAWQWPGTVANLRANGRVAVTFARPSDYVSYQIKGCATVAPATEDDRVNSSRYLADIRRVLAGLGLEPRLVAPWLIDRDLVAVAVDVASIYVQTPGPKAGLQLATSSP
jgi:hypothetical protein